MKCFVLLETQFLPWRPRSVDCFILGWFFSAPSRTPFCQTWVSVFLAASLWSGASSSFGFLFFLVALLLVFTVIDVLFELPCSCIEMQSWLGGSLLTLIRLILCQPTRSPLRDWFSPTGPEAFQSLALGSLRACSCRSSGTISVYLSSMSLSGWVTWANRRRV